MYLGRRPDGSVYGLWFNPQPHDADHPGLEEVDETHPDVLAFRARPRRVVLHEKPNVLSTRPTRKKRASK